MDVREKLVEQLRWWATECDRTNFGCQARKLLVEAADYIAHGVTVQEQDGCEYCNAENAEWSEGTSHDFRIKGNALFFVKSS